MRFTDAMLSLKFLNLNSLESLAFSTTFQLGICAASSLTFFGSSGGMPASQGMHRFWVRSIVIFYTTSPPRASAMLDFFRPVANSRYVRAHPENSYDFCHVR